MSVTAAGARDGAENAATYPLTHHAQAQLLDAVQAAGPVMATVDIQALAGSWETVALPYTFKSPAAPGEPGVLQTRWFRIHLPPVSQAQVAGVHLYVVRWQVAGHIAIYGDGRLMHRSLGNPTANLTRQLSLALPLNPGQSSTLPRDILVRLDSFAGTPGGLSSLYTGPSDDMLSMYGRREWLQNRLPEMGSMAFMAMGALSLMVWWRRRKEKLFLFVGIYAALHGARQWILLSDLPQAPGSDDGWLTFSLVNYRVWQLVVTQYVMMELHGVMQPRAARAFLGVGIGFTLLTALLELSGIGLLTLRPAWLAFTLAMALAVLGMGLHNSLRTRSRDGVLLGVVLLGNTALAIYEALKANLVLPMEWPPLFPYTIGIYTVTLMFIMTRRYVGALGQVEEANLGLAQRLREREEELENSYQRLREIEHQQTLANERRRLMQDMHDGIGSSLTGAIRAVDDGALDKPALAQMLRDCLDDLKLTIDSMETADPDLPLLLGTLRFRLAANIQGAGIELHWNVERLPPLGWLDPSTALNILRILQESVANVLRHTRATELRIGATEAAREGRPGVEVVVQDNGMGFAVEPTVAGSAGRGLQNQQRRAHACQGEVRWESGPGGTRFVLWLPLAWNA
ncbi:sensor histidine kinase [Ramlibacter sp. WS9]|nr:sensor histidine kinase [Ramlibacter sp. WS9]